MKLRRFLFGGSRILPRLHFMTKYIAAILFCFTAFCAHAQTEYNIPGTQVYMTMPEGFKPSNKFAGFTGEEEAYIEAMELPSDFQFLRNSFSYMCKQEGYTIYAEQDTTVSGYPAMFFTMGSEPEVKVNALIFGDHAFTVVMKGSYPVNETQMGEDVVKAMLGLRYQRQGGERGAKGGE